MRENDLENISLLILFLCLMILSIWDVRYKKIPLILIIGGSVIGIIIGIFRLEFGWKIPLFGALIGFFFVFLSFILKEKIGYGDGLIIAMTGIYVGFENTMGIVIVSFLCIFPVALCIYIKNHVQKANSKNIEIPYIPFLFFSYVIFLMNNRGYLG
jgi:leader peptidase (prepilin peptidase)/N-methyltransferase